MSSTQTTLNSKIVLISCISRQNVFKKLDRYGLNFISINSTHKIVRPSISTLATSIILGIFLLLQPSSTSCQSQDNLRVIIAPDIRDTCDCAIDKSSHDSH